MAHYPISFDGRSETKNSAVHFLFNCGAMPILFEISQELKKCLPARSQPICQKIIRIAQDPTGAGKRQSNGNAKEIWAHELRYSWSNMFGTTDGPYWKFGGKSGAVGGT